MDPLRISDADHLLRASCQVTPTTTVPAPCPYCGQATRPEIVWTRGEAGNAAGALATMGGVQFPSSQPWQVTC